MSTAATATAPALATASLVPPIREASRRLVREWGFLRPTLAGTELSPAAAHCLYEIGENNVRTGPALREALAVGEAELARALEDLTTAGEIETVQKRDEGEEEEGTEEEAFFALTARGRRTLRAINLAAANQVQAALEACAPAAVTTIVGGLQIYAAALQALRQQQQQDVTARAAAALSVQALPVVDIVAGYQPGLLARALEMHMAYYSRHYGWGRTFETTLGAGLADLLGRIDRPANEAWAAVQTTTTTTTTSNSSTTTTDRRIVGTIFIDGEDLGSPGVVAHLRAFIVDDGARGSGAGRKLLDAALGFVRQAGFAEVQLWTMRPLVAARRLYEAAGFEEVSEEERLEFGVVTKVMHYRWRRPGLPLPGGCDDRPPALTVVEGDQ